MACRGISEACRALNTPVTGGNVSLYNETKKPDGTVQPIHPTPVIGMVGGVDDIAQVTGLGWRRPDDPIYLIGVPPSDPDDPCLGLAGSAYQEQCVGSLAGRPPQTDLVCEAAAGQLVREAIRQGLLASAHDCSDGGLAVALAEASIASDCGIEITLSMGQARLDRVLFAEGGHRIIVSLKAERQSEWDQLIDSEIGLNVTPIGVVLDQKRLTIQSETSVLLNLELEACRSAFSNALSRRIDSD